jgi:hypothetical protein
MIVEFFTILGGVMVSLLISPVFLAAGVKIAEFCFEDVKTWGKKED